MISRMALHHKCYQRIGWSRCYLRYRKHFYVKKFLGLHIGSEDMADEKLEQQTGRAENRDEDQHVVHKEKNISIL